MFGRAKILAGQRPGAKAFLPGHLPWLAWCSAATDSIGFIPILSVLLLPSRFCSYSLGFVPSLSVLLLFYRFCSYSIGCVPIPSVLFHLSRCCSYSLGF